MTRKPTPKVQQILDLKGENPGMSTNMIAGQLNCTEAYVRTVLRLGTERTRALLPHLLKISEAAAYLHVHPNTLRRWDKKIPHYVFGSRGDRFFKREHLDKYMKENFQEVEPSGN